MQLKTHIFEIKKSNKSLQDIEVVWLGYKITQKAFINSSTAFKKRG